MASVLFLNIYIGSLSKTPFHSGIAALSASCKSAGIKTEVITITQKEEYQHHIDRVRSSQADFIAVSISSPEWNNVKEFLDMLKKHGEKRPVIAGGYHPTIKPEEVISHSLIKYLFLGEADEPFPELIRTLEAGKTPDDIPNLWFKVKRFFRTKVIRNPITYLPQNLDSLPEWDREIFLEEWKTTPEALSGMGGIPVQAGRGCPFSCAFCCNKSFREVLKEAGQYVRKRSPENVIREMKRLISRYDPPAFELWDELFLLDREWTSEFCHIYKEEIRMPFSALIRADITTKDMLETLYEAGCRLVMIGVETGNETMRREILKKNISDEQLIRVFNWCKEIRLDTFAFIMLGIPGETEETLKETVELCKKLKPTFLGPQIFYPLPKTELGEKTHLTGQFYNNPLHPNYKVPVVRETKVSPSKVVEAFQELTRMNEEFAQDAFFWSFDYKEMKKRAKQI